MKKTVPVFLTLCLALLLAACGGGGGGGNTPAAPPAGLGVTPLSAPRIEPYEQGTTRALAKSGASLDAALVPGPLVRLGALSPDALAGVAVAQSFQGGRNTPRQIGLNRALVATATAAATMGLLQWTALPGGGSATAVSFRAEGAAAVRLALSVERLPAEAVVRVYAPAGGEVVALTGSQILASLASQAGNGPRPTGATLFWLPTVSGDAATLELALPAGADPASVAVAVPSLSHLWVDLASPKAQAQLKLASSSCNVDATCMADWSTPSRSVARMMFVSGASAYLCTGTLMADVAGSGTPWLLSANHCISDQVSASTLETYWFYRATACNSGALNPGATRVFGGATLLYTSAASDTSFMRLNSAVPTGAYFAGSLLAAPPLDVPIAGLHHPGGDLLKFSQGALVGYAACSGVNCTPQSSSTGADYLTVRWTAGTTESGSSGSAVFTPVGAGQYVTGHLFAGLASCTTPDSPDYYGRFDVAYRAALHQYLGEVAGAR
ncbi:MAG: trypsin-like serine protease [Pseudomonadota bacterium]